MSKLQVHMDGKHGSVMFGGIQMIGRMSDNICFLWPTEKINQSIALNAQVPHAMMASLVGEHPERLIEGFIVMDKPRGYEFTNATYMKDIHDLGGTVLIELEVDSRFWCPEKTRILQALVLGEEDPYRHSSKKPPLFSE